MKKKISQYYVLALDPIMISTYKAPQNDRLDLSFVKDKHTNGKKWPEMVVTRSFKKGHSFPITLYVHIYFLTK